MAEIQIYDGPSWLAICSQVDLLKPRTLRLLGRLWSYSDLCGFLFDLCGDRSPGYGRGSVAWLRVGLWVGLDRGSGSGVRVQNLISGPRPAKLERQSELFFVRSF